MSHTILIRCLQNKKFENKNDQSNKRPALQRGHCTASGNSGRQNPRKKERKILRHHNHSNSSKHSKHPNISTSKQHLCVQGPLWECLRAILASLLLHTTCVLSCCNWRASCKAANHKQRKGNCCERVDCLVHMTGEFKLTNLVSNPQAPHYQSRRRVRIRTPHFI